MCLTTSMVTVWKLTTIWPHRENILGGLHHEYGLETVAA